MSTALRRWQILFLVSDNFNSFISANQGNKELHYSSVQSVSRVWLFVTPWLKQGRPPCPSPTPGVYSNSCPLSRWYHPIISSSVVPFSSCLQSFPASGSFQMCQFFASGGQSIGVSVSASVFPVNIQDWFPLGLIVWISLLSKGLSRVFSSIAVWKHQFLSTQSPGHLQTKESGLEKILLS